VEDLVAFDAPAWAAAPRQFSPEAVDLYKALARAGDYGPWWSGICGGTSPSLRRFLIRTEAALWECPWEAQIAALDRRYWADVSLVRAVDGGARVVQLAVVGDALRVLVLQGAEEEDGLARLDLAAEFEALESARADLDRAARDSVAPIMRRSATRANLAQILAEGRANLLWFSGHGRADPPGLLLSDGHWLTPEELAEAVRAAATAGAAAPLYMVLWACRTGLLERFSAPRAAPPFVAALAEQGVAAVLTTQAPLADSFAQALAGAILSNAAAGLPIDHALARARGAAMPQQVDDGATDWACPTVWAVDLPVDRIWFSPLALGARWQGMSRRLAAIEPLSADLDGAAEQDQSARWTRHPRVWVTSPTPDAVAVRSGWASRMLGQQRLAPEVVIVVDLAATTVQAGLQAWAERLLREIAQADDPDRRLRTVATLVRSDLEGGWTALCALEGVTLGVVAPKDAPDWFWDQLHKAAGRVCVLERSFPAARAAEAWQPDVLMNQPLQNVDAFAADPQVAAFAVLAAPAQLNDIETVAPKRLPAWISEGLVDQTRAGCVMPLSRAEAIARAMTPEQSRAAHEVAFHYLDGARAQAALREEDQETLRRARLHHAQAGQLQDAMLTTSQDLMALHRDRHRPAALLSVFEQAKPLRRRLDEVWKVSAGWAFLQGGDVVAAKAWLNSADADRLSEADYAVRDMNLAEAEKASGLSDSKTRARELLEAVWERTTGVALRPQHLAAQHDLARLTHFVDHRAADAIPLYQAVEQAWAEEGGNRLERAIALRNLAEAHMTVAKEIAAGEAGQALADAERAIDEARDLLPPFSGHTVASELEYVAGRLLSRQGRDKEEVIDQLERCRAKALDTNHLMLAAIVEARLFWLQRDPERPFDPEAWRERAASLAPFVRHGWAARVLINGHIRSAQLHAKQGEARRAVKWLDDANAILDTHPAFDQGDDRLRTAMVHAGLAELGRNQGLWNQFKAGHPWAPAWAVGARAKSINVWAEAI
jgi:tetratricopeptide (TPR) repeat protein